MVKRKPLPRISITRFPPIKKSLNPKTLNPIDEDDLENSLPSESPNSLNLNPLPSNEVFRLNGKRITMVQKIAILTLIESGQITIRDLAESEGISVQGIYNIVNDSEVRALLSPNVEQTKKHLPGMFYRLTTRAIEAISDEKLSKSNAVQLSQIATFSHNNARLAAGLSTDNITVRELVPRLVLQLDETVKKRERILEMIKKRDGSYAIPEGNL